MIAILELQRVVMDPENVAGALVSLDRSFSPTIEGGCGLIDFQRSSETHKSNSRSLEASKKKVQNTDEFRKGIL